MRRQNFAISLPADGLAALALKDASAQDLLTWFNFHPSTDKY